MTIEIKEIIVKKECVEITFWNSNTMKENTEIYYWNMLDFNLKFDI
jgi:hypothetical protein